MRRKKLLVVGNGMAGIRCVEEILKLDPELFDITIFGAEPRPNYNRILLSKVLQGEHSLQDIILNDWSWYAWHSAVGRGDRLSYRYQIPRCRDSLRYTGNV